MSDGKFVWFPVSERMPPSDAHLLVVWGDHKAVDKAHTFSKWKHPTHPLGYLIIGARTTARRAQR